MQNDDYQRFVEWEIGHAAESDIEKVDDFFYPDCYISHTSSWEKYVSKDTH